MTGMAMSAGAGVATSHNWNRVQNPDSSIIMHDFDLTDELSPKVELHMLRPITEKVHSGNGRVSLVIGTRNSAVLKIILKDFEKKKVVGMEIRNIHTHNGYTLWFISLTLVLLGY